MKKILLTLGLLGLMSCAAVAQEVDIAAKWEFDSTVEPDGFKIYVKKSDSEKFSLVKNVTESDARKWSGRIDLPIGDNTFVCTAYKTIDAGYRESGHSNSVAVNPNLFNAIPVNFSVSIVFQSTITVK